MLTFPISFNQTSTLQGENVIVWNFNNGTTAGRTSEGTHQIPLDLTNSFPTIRTSISGSGYILPGIRAGNSPGYFTAIESGNDAYYTDDWRTFFDRGLFSFNEPFAISCWVVADTDSSGDQIVVQFRTATNSVSAIDQFWGIQIAPIVDADNESRFSFSYRRASGSSIATTGTVTFSKNSRDFFEFFYIRYDPIEYRKVYFGKETEPEQFIQFTEDYYYDGSYSFPSSTVFQVAGTTGSNEDIGIDQLAIWHTTPVTRQDMLDVYNNKLGVTLPDNRHLFNGYGWEFQDTTEDQTRTYSFVKSSGSVSYTPGKFPTYDGLSSSSLTNNTYDFYIEGYPTNMVLDWNRSWGFSIWLNHNTTSNTFKIVAFADNTSTADSNRVWEWRMQHISQTFRVVNNSDVEEVATDNYTANSSWNFYWITYNVANPKQITIGRNNATGTTYTFTNDFKSVTNNTRRLYMFVTSTSNLSRIDQFIYYNYLPVPSSIYNGGSGTLVI